MNRKLILGLATIALLLVGAIVAVTVTRLSRDRAAERTATAPPPKAEPFVTSRTVATEAVPALQAAADKAPGDARAWERLGNALFAEKNFDQAIIAYRKAVAIDPASSTLWSMLGESYIQTEQSSSQAMPKEARKAFVNALARDPGDVRSLFYMAMEKDFAGRHDEAINDYIVLLSKVPKGSAPEEAIRGAIAASVDRNLRVTKQRIDEASKRQPVVAPVAASTAAPVAH